MSRCKLEEFISYEQPAKYIVDSDQYDDSYETPVLTAGKSFILGYTDETNNIFDNLPVIIFDDFTTSVQFVDFPFKVKSSAMKLLKNTEQADIKYCYYLLKFLQHTPENHKRQWLSATSQNIVELPTIEEQKNIVKKLDKILEVIDNQNKQLELLDEAIKARFMEMFGDVRNNPYNFSKVKLGKICDVRDGTHDSPKYQAVGYPLITSKNLTSGEIDFSNCNYIKEEDLKKINLRSEVTRGDIIMPMIGTIGNPIIVNTDIQFAIKNVALIKFNNGILQNIYVKYLLSSDYFDFSILRNVRGGTQKFIALKDLRDLDVLIPPLELQNQFASFVEEIDKSRSRIQKSLEASQELFDSLIQEYFG